jgi:hypothetical protein
MIILEIELMLLEAHLVKSNLIWLNYIVKRSMLQEEEDLKIVNKQMQIVSVLFSA